MAPVDPEALYREFELDPQDYGYRVGLGVPFNTKREEINQSRAEISIQRVAEDTPVDPGEVAEAIPVQLIRDAIDSDEYKANCDPTSGDDQVRIGQKASLRDRIASFYGGSDGQSQFAFTSLSKSQILDLFTNAFWPTTRANLIDLQTREGSRAEELFGSPDAPVTNNDMLAAEQWRATNEPQKPSLYT